MTTEMDRCVCVEPRLWLNESECASYCSNCGRRFVGLATQVAGSVHEVRAEYKVLALPAPQK